MSKKTKNLLILLVVIVVAVIMVLAISNNKAKTEIDTTSNSQKTTESNNKKANPDVVANSVLKDAVAEVPGDNFVIDDIKVPEVNELIPNKLKDVVAVPKIVAEAAPGVDTKYRSFDIRGEGNKFIPSQIIVHVGDTVHVNFSAVDKEYDILFSGYNIKQSVNPGEKKIIEFQALEPGNFIYYCVSCGGINSEAKGNFIIVK